MKNVRVQDGNTNDKLSYLFNFFPSKKYKTTWCSFILVHYVKTYDFNYTVNSGVQISKQKKQIVAIVIISVNEYKTGKINQLKKKFNQIFKNESTNN